ncbi:hypothetical protein M758_2G084500 [Ceratodon purpureus]|nr:hypothetical protein M758_2G084500 [Ceratodon purpureus]
MEFLKRLTSPCIRPRVRQVERASKPHIHRSRDMHSVDLCMMPGSSENERGGPLPAHTTTTNLGTALASAHVSECSQNVVDNSVEEQIEQSKSHWSQVVMSDTISDEEEVADNLREFEQLQSHSTWGSFFRTFGYDTKVSPSSGELEIREKFAEGGQAELFHAKVIWKNVKNNAGDLENGIDWFLKVYKRNFENEIEWVLKVFKKGTLLRYLQSQWPQGMLQFHAHRLERSTLGIPQDLMYTCHVGYGILLKNGRFAFLMKREREDLRNFIDHQMKLNIKKGFGPFVQDDVVYIMYRVAQGVEWLHKRNIVHRDLKASNVLHTSIGDDYLIADFECSIGVIGTGFWRAPEILQACRDRIVNTKPELFTKKANIYSYGMTCYEVVTGKLPFQGQRVTMEDVINGQRPEVPEYVGNWTSELLSMCWQSNPTSRPSIEKILEIILANSRVAKVINEEQMKWKLNPIGMQLRLSAKWI